MQISTWALTRSSSRVASYWSDLRGREHLAPMVAAVAAIEAVACDSAHEAAWLERNLLETSLPRWNRMPGGQESAVYIRMDTRPAAPGLFLAYRAEPAAQVRHFGPYLGRQRGPQGDHRAGQDRAAVLDRHPAARRRT
jgi:excinuclease ABC subunit C